MYKSQFTLTNINTTFSCGVESTPSLVFPACFHINSDYKCYPGAANQMDLLKCLSAVVHRIQHC